MRAVAGAMAGVTQRIAIMDRKRKQEMAHKLSQRWQRWEISNFDYLMSVSS